MLPQRRRPRLVDFMEALARRYPDAARLRRLGQPQRPLRRQGRRWTRFNARHGGRFHFVYTPKHASWMNQVEIWFSILHRRIIRYGDFGSTDHQKNEVEALHPPLEQERGPPVPLDLAHRPRQKSAAGRSHGRRRCPSTKLKTPTPRLSSVSSTPAISLTFAREVPRHRHRRVRSQRTMPTSTCVLPGRRPRLVPPHRRPPRSLGTHSLSRRLPPRRRLDDLLPHNWRPPGSYPTGLSGFRPPFTSSSVGRLRSSDRPSAGQGPPEQPLAH